MTKKILVTGGPVHANLDAVKIITNKFKGGTIAKLAEKLAMYHDDGFKVTYLCAKGSVVPKPDPFSGIEIVFHDGFEDYKNKILEYAKTFDAMILGAAVTNLIPLNPWKDKFPSHNYKEGDVIPIDFTIAPRVINMVKKVNPRITLIGFKLLSGVPEEELIRAAKEVLVGSKADCVMANLAEDLENKIAICKDFSMHRLKAAFKTYHNEERDGMLDATFIHDLIMDEHYRTEVSESNNGFTSKELFDLLPKAKAIAEARIEKYKQYFVPNEAGYIFGSVAVRIMKGVNAFLTTSRGKKDINSFSFVYDVDHEKRVVLSSKVKPTLNAPLLHMLFDKHPEVNVIVHLHKPPELGTYVLPWAPPGTVRDTMRMINSKISNSGEQEAFYIFNHGVFIMDWHKREV